MASKKEVAKAKAADEEIDVFENIDVEIVRQGTTIILPNHPEPMSYDSAINALERKRKEEETVVAINEPINAFPWDGANAFMLAMRERYGWAQAVPKKTWFGKIPPTVVSIEIGPRIEDTASIIWGSFSLPNVEGELETGWTMVEGRPAFYIGGEIKRKHHAEIVELARLTRRLVREKSIYKGKALRLKCKGNGQLDNQLPPKFINIDDIRPEELIFPRETEALVKTNVLTPIERTNLCRKFQVPLSRGILLEGPYGVGKTLLAGVVARICQERGWTFMMIDQVSALQTAIDFARLYAPAVVFAEDIDRVLKGERTVEMDKILNTIDGVQSKSDEIITVLTTNNVELINQAMLRPGRLDAVISITPPDAEAAERLVRIYGRGLIEENEKLTKSGKALEGQIPAVIREVVERSKLGALARTADEDADKIRLTDQDLATQAVGMRRHLELLNGPRDVIESPEEKLGKSLRDIVVSSVPKSFEKVSATLTQTGEQVEEAVNEINMTYSELADKVNGLHNKVDDIRKNI